VRTIALLRGYLTKITLIKSIKHKSSDHPQLHHLLERTPTETDHEVRNYFLQEGEKRPLDIPGDEGELDVWVRMKAMKKTGYSSWSCSFKTPSGFTHRVSVSRTHKNSWECHYIKEDRESSIWPGEFVNIFIHELDESKSESMPMISSEDPTWVSLENIEIFDQNDYIETQGRTRPVMPMKNEPSSPEAELFVWAICSKPGDKYFTAYDFDEVDKKNLPEEIEYARIDWHRLL
jgi:hypothetical protein